LRKVLEVEKLGQDDEFRFVAGGGALRTRTHTPRFLPGDLRGCSSE
jgi:hypothetical protein